MAMKLWDGPVLWHKAVLYSGADGGAGSEVDGSADCRTNHY